MTGRILISRVEVEAFPVDAVVLDADECIMQKESTGSWRMVGNDDWWTSADVRVPARVLYDPTEDN
jgi:hypothetical protein